MAEPLNSRHRPGWSAGEENAAGVQAVPSADRQPVALTARDSFDRNAAVTEPTRAGSDGRGVLVIACGALAREVQSALDASRLDHIALTCLPAILHNRPQLIPEAVRAAIRANRDRYAHIAVAYADCGTGGLLDQVCEEEGVSRIAGPHCYAFYWGNEAFRARGDADMDAFYLTDFLARQFEAFVVEPLGLDRHPELRDLYFGNYRRLIYLAQTDDPLLEKRAIAAASRLGLVYEKHVTGLGDLPAFAAALPES